MEELKGRIFDVSGSAVILNRSAGTKAEVFISALTRNCLKQFVALKKIREDPGALFVSYFWLPFGTSFISRGYWHAHCFGTFSSRTFTGEGGELLWLEGKALGPLAKRGGGVGACFCGG